MGKRQCQAFVESKGRRCEKNIRWAKKYCWWHYPKGGPVSALILGALLGLILTLLFSQPLRAFLSPHWPFHYLDRNSPTIVAVLPDIRASDYVDADTRTFSLTCRDDCSGLDLARSRIDLYRLRDKEYEPMGGKSTTIANTFEYMVDTQLMHGEYLLRITACDKANNRSEPKHAFVVPESELIDIKISSEEYDEADHRKLLPSLPNGTLKVFDRTRLYVYHFILYNKGEKTYCKNIHVTINTSGAIYSWKEVGGMDYTGVVSLSIAESFDKTIQKHQVFVSQRVLTIEEIAPGGHVHFVALVGFMQIDNRPELSSATDVGVFGTYISEGYGRTTIVHIRRWIPIKKRNSGD